MCQIIHLTSKTRRLKVLLNFEVQQFNSQVNSYIYRVSGILKSMLSTQKTENKFKIANFHCLKLQEKCNPLGI